jgi:hypothetical protein
MWKPLNTALFTLLALGACQEDTREPPPPTDESANYSSSLGADPDFSSPDGRIKMTLWFAYEETYLSGQFTDGPSLQFRTESEQIGQCRLLSYTASTCIPICADMDVCIEGECRSWPVRQDRGEIHWMWPDGEQDVAPDALLGYYASGAATEAGEAKISFEELSLSAPTIDSTEAVGDWASIIRARGAGNAVLEWSNPVEHARVRLFMTDCTGSHGGIGAAELECEGPDTGEMVLPGSFLDALDAGDWTHGECGSHTLERYYAAAPDGDDTIRFETVAETGMFYRPDF